MGRYLLSRLAGVVGVLLAVSLITFVLMHAVPGGPFDVMGINRSVAIPDNIKRQLEAKYGLDQPVLVQYVIFVKNAMRLDFRYSFFYQSQTVVQILERQWPYSAQLGLMTMAFSIVVGVGLGIAAAMNQGSWIDHTG